MGCDDATLHAQNDGIGETASVAAVFAAASSQSAVDQTCGHTGWGANQNFQPYIVPAWDGELALCRVALAGSLAQHEPSCAASPPDATFHRLCWCLASRRLAEAGERAVERAARPAPAAQPEGFLRKLADSIQRVPDLEYHSVAARPTHFPNVPRDERV
jgi:hypothetical protein